MRLDRNFMENTWSSFCCGKSLFSHFLACWQIGYVGRSVRWNMLWAKCCICSIPVISSVELSLDADVQTSNLLIAFLKYSSIVMQDTKGKTCCLGGVANVKGQLLNFEALTFEPLGLLCR